MFALFPNRLFSGARAARKWTGRVAVLLLIAAFLQIPSTASANLTAQSFLPLPPRQLEPPDHSYVSTADVTFRWAPTEGAPRYILEIYREDRTRAQDKIEVVVEGTETYTHNGLTPGYTYTWSVSVDFATSGSNQDFFEFTLSGEQLAPRAPEAVFAADGNHIDEIFVYWHPSYRTAYYLLQRRAQGSTNFIDLARVGEERQFVDHEGVPGVHFAYRVLACNHVGCSQPSPVDEGWVGICQPIGAPSLVAPTNGSDILIFQQAPWYTLEWVPVPNARSHIVRIFDSETGYLLDENEMNNEGADSYEVTGVVGNLRWYVFATNPVQGCPNGPRSETWHYTAAFNPPPPVPNNLQASDGLYPDQIRLTWNQPASDYDVENWQIFRSTNSDMSTAVEIVATADKNFIDTEVVPGTVYHYWVEACSHADGCSEKSEPDTGFAGESAAILDIAVYIPLLQR